MKIHSKNENEKKVIHHSSIAIKGWERALFSPVQNEREMAEEVLLHDDGTNYTREEILFLIFQCRKKGWKIVPTCPTPDPETGECLGHEEEQK